jgi:hypothetical protein
VKALNRLPSDHNPLLIDLGCNLSFGKKRFMFEKWWLEKNSCTDIVCKTWAISYNEQNNLDRWQFRIRNFRRSVRGWVAKEVDAMNKRKGELAVE